MEIISFALFLVASHFGVMQLFRMTTYHLYFWKAFPLLIIYGAFVAWALYALEMHAFFFYQLILASIWLFVIGRKQNRIAETVLASAGQDADYVRSLAASTTRTSRYYAYSSFIYISVFAVTYTWLYNT